MNDTVEQYDDPYNTVLERLTDLEARVERITHALTHITRRLDGLDRVMNECSPDFKGW